MKSTIREEKSSLLTGFCILSMNYLAGLKQGTYLDITIIPFAIKDKLFPVIMV